MKEIYRATDPMQAHLLCGLLKSHGFAAEVGNELAFGTRGEAPMDMSTLPTILVPDEVDVKAAVLLIEDYLGSDPSADAGPAWSCECGETSEGQFSSCWRCGEARPSVDPAAGAGLAT